MYSKKGFAHPEVLLGAGAIVVVIAIVLFSGVLVRGNQTTDPSIMEGEQMEDSMNNEGTTMENDQTMVMDMPLTNTYSHPSGATMQYPDGWILDDNSDTPSVVYKDKFAVNSAGNGAGVLIITSSLPESADFEDFAMASGESFAQQFGADVGEPTAITINGVEVYMFEFSFLQSGVELTANLYFVPGNGVAYALFATGETTLFSKYETVLTDIVQSFQV